MFTDKGNYVYLPVSKNATSISSSSKFGTNPKNYIVERRLLYAEQILKSGEYINITQVAEIVGFEDSLYFSKCFKAYFGI